MPDERYRRKQSEQGRGQPASYQGPRGYKRIPHQQSEQASARAPPVVQHSVFCFRLLEDCVPGLDHNRAESCALRVIDTLIIDCDAEVAGGAKSLDLRVQLFQRAPDGLLPLVDAEEDLSARSVFQAGESAVLPVA